MDYTLQNLKLIGKLAFKWQYPSLRKWKYMCVCVYIYIYIYVYIEIGEKQSVHNYMLQNTETKRYCVTIEQSRIIYCHAYYANL